MRRIGLIVMMAAAFLVQQPAWAAEKEMLEKIREDIKGRKIFNPSEQTPEAKRPVITDDGPVSPLDGSPLEVLFLKADKENPSAVKIAAFWSPAGNVYWTFVWGGPSRLSVLSGPFDLRTVTLDMVRKAIEKLITADDSFGFYDGQFAEIEKMGKAAVPWLFELFRDESNRKSVRVLALEALGDMKDNSVIPKLRELIHNPSYSDHQNPIAFTLAKLGDHTYSDIIIERYTNYVRTNEGNQKAQAAGYAGLAHAYSRLKEHQKAVDCYKKVLELEDEDKGGAYYNLACSLVKLGKHDEAIEALRKCAEEGYDDWKWMLMDGDLAPLRELPEFKKVIEEIKKKQKK